MTINDVKRGSDNLSAKWGLEGGRFYPRESERDLSETFLWLFHPLPLTWGNVVYGKKR